MADKPDRGNGQWPDGRAVCTKLPPEGGQDPKTQPDACAKTQQRLNKDSTKTQRLKAQRLKTPRLKDSKKHKKKRKLRTVNGDRTHDGSKLTPGAVHSTLSHHLYRTNLDQLQHVSIDEKFASRSSETQIKAALDESQACHLGAVSTKWSKRVKQRIKRGIHAASNILMGILLVRWQRGRVMVQDLD